VDALDHLRHPGDQLIPVDEVAVDVVRALEEDDMADSGTGENIAIETLDRGGAALGRRDGDPVPSDALVDAALLAKMHCGVVDAVRLRESLTGRALTSLPTTPYGVRSMRRPSP
jgi:hypothetical protein